MPRDCWLSLLGAMFLRLPNDVLEGWPMLGNGRQTASGLTEGSINRSVWEIYV